MKDVTKLQEYELLELSVRAYGYNKYEGHAAQMIQSGWNPLLDDGDALRLAVKLHLTVGYDVEDGMKISWVRESGVFTFEFWADNLDNPSAATRRAIVRAAAAVGRDIK